MAEVISMADFKASANQLVTDQIRDLLSESWELMDNMPGLPTVQEREQAVIRSTDLKMKARELARTIGMTISADSKPGVFILTRVWNEGDLP